jgi:hypothetical protein
MFGWLNCISIAAIYLKVQPTNHHKKTLQQAPRSKAYLINSKPTFGKARLIDALLMRE